MIKSILASSLITDLWVLQVFVMVLSTPGLFYYLLKQSFSRQVTRQQHADHKCIRDTQLPLFLLPHPTPGLFYYLLKQYTFHQATTRKKLGS